MNAREINANAELWLTPGQAADLVNVNPRTVTRWAQSGKIRYITTVGGHRRYPCSEINALLLSMQTTEKDLRRNR